MFRAQDLLPDPERFLVERFGFGVLAHILVQVGQVIEAVRRVGMFVPSHVIRGSFLTLIRRKFWNGIGDLTGFRYLLVKSWGFSEFRAQTGESCLGLLTEVLELGMRRWWRIDR